MPRTRRNKRDAVDSGDAVVVERSAAATATALPADRQSLLGRRLTESVFPVLGLVLAGVYLQHAGSDGWGTTYAYPLFMMGAVAVFALVCLGVVWTRRGGGVSALGRHTSDVALQAARGATGGGKPDDDADVPPVQDRPLSRVDLILPLGLALYMLVSHFAGLVVASAVVVALMAPLLRYRKIVPVVLGAVGTGAVIWLIFSVLLDLQLPGGTLGVYF